MSETEPGLELSQRLSAVERRLDEFDDRQEIMELLNDYGRFADSGQHEQFTSLFTEDGEIELFGGEPSGTYADHVSWKGHDAIMTFIRDPKVHMAIQGNCMHLPSIGLTVTLDGSDAVAYSSALVLVRREDGIVINGAGFTKWSLKKVAGRWRIRKRQRRSIGIDADQLAEWLTSGEMTGTARA